MLCVVSCVTDAECYMRVVHMRYVVCEMVWMLCRVLCVLWVVVYAWYAVWCVVLLCVVVVS